MHGSTLAVYVWQQLHPAPCLWTALCLLDPLGTTNLMAAGRIGFVREHWHAQQHCPAEAYGVLAGFVGMRNSTRERTAAAAGQRRGCMGIATSYVGLIGAIPVN